LLELALVTIIAGILITLFLNRALGLMTDVERVNLLQWESKIKTALSHELSRVVVAGDFAKIDRLESINPMRLLQDVPRSYLGEKMHPDLAMLPEGSWIYDTSRKVLVYTIDNSDRFTSDLSGRPRAEYQVQLDYQDNNLNHRFDFKLDTLRSLQLVTLGQYQWLSDVDG
jgi:hypothetical protein